MHCREVRSRTQRVATAPTSLVPASTAINVWTASGSVKSNLCNMPALTRYLSRKAHNPHAQLNETHPLLVDPAAPLPDGTHVLCTRNIINKASMTPGQRVLVDGQPQGALFREKMKFSLLPFHAAVHALRRVDPLVRIVHTGLANTHCKTLLAFLAIFRPSAQPLSWQARCLALSTGSNSSGSLFSGYLVAILGSGFKLWMEGQHYSWHTKMHGLHSHCKHTE